MNVPKISKRLEAAASFSRRGARFADVGTDHAYLPIYLFATGKSEGGVASDINEGPAERARANVKAWGAQNAIQVVRTDGLCGIEQYEPRDIFILGMGGELIVKIISEAPWLKTADKRLVLQPMTRPEILREYLGESGFRIVDEALVRDEKIYQIICAEYSAEQETADPLELLVGKINLARGGDLICELLTHQKKIFSERLAGKKSAGADACFEAWMIDEIDKKLAEVRKNEDS